MGIKVRDIRRSVEREISDEKFGAKEKDQY